MDMNWSETKKPMTYMLIGVGVLFGGIFLYKIIMGLLIQHFIKTAKAPTVTVSAMTVHYADWQPKVRATGSTRATKGVYVTAQLGGMIQKIYLTPGALVHEGDVLVQQNADPDIGQLHALQANAELARITLARDKLQYKAKAISKQQLDTDEQNLKSLTAQVAQQSATVAMKTIRAPFSGRLGISSVNPGQYLNPGDKIIPLQTLDPIYVDFYVPQQLLPQLRTGQHVTVTSDSFPGKIFTGKITTIDPIVDTSTRNVQVEATVANPGSKLNPGMFTRVEVDAGKPKNYLTVPQTAVSFNPYGDIVYIVHTQKDKDGEKTLIAKQSFVVTGETRGDQVTIVEGLKEGDTIVTSGQLKLKNGSQVAINNSVQPANNPEPIVTNEHGG